MFDHRRKTGLRIGLFSACALAFAAQPVVAATLDVTGAFMNYDLKRFAAPMTASSSAEDQKTGAASSGVLTDRLTMTPLAPMSGVDAAAYLDTTGTFWAETLIGAAPKAGTANTQWEGRLVRSSDPGMPAIRFHVDHAWVNIFDGNPLGFDPWIMTAEVFSVVRMTYTIGGTNFEQLKSIGMHVEGNRGPEDGWTVFPMGTMSAAYTEEYDYGTTGDPADTVGVRVDFDPFDITFDVGAIPVGTEIVLAYEITTSAQGEGTDSAVGASFRDPFDPEGNPGVAVHLDVTGFSAAVPEPAALALPLLGAALLRRGRGKRRRA